MVLSRKKNERIVIGENIVVTIVEIRGDKVRLGFDAPAEVPIWREELTGLKQEQSLRGRPEAPGECLAMQLAAAGLPVPIPAADGGAR